MNKIQDSYRGLNSMWLEQPFKSIKSNDIKPLISIVITTKNEELHIENCLRSIRYQTYPQDRIELIVVDNYSVDKTKEIALRFTNLVFNKGPERNAQRNYGMLELSTGEYVMWVDADMILSPSLIEDCLDYITVNNYVALFVPEIVIGCGYWSRVRRFERSFYDNTVIDGSRFIRRKDFVSAGGFSTEWMHGPDDWDLDKSLKRIGRIGYIKRKNGTGWRWGEDYLRHRCVEPSRYGVAIYHDESNFTLRRYLSKKKHYIADFQRYITKWGHDDPDLIKQLGFWYRYFWVFMENGKWVRVLCNPLLFLSVIFLRGAVGIIYLWNKPIAK